MLSFLQLCWIGGCTRTAPSICEKERLLERRRWMADPLAHPALDRFDQRQLGDLPAAELRARRPA